MDFAAYIFLDFRDRRPGSRNSTSEYLGSSSNDPTESNNSLGTVRVGVEERTGGEAGSDVMVHVMRKAS